MCPKESELPFYELSDVQVTEKKLAALKKYREMVDSISTREARQAVLKIAVALIDEEKVRQGRKVKKTH